MLEDNSVQTHSQDSPELVLLSHTDLEEQPQSNSSTVSSTSTFNEHFPLTPRQTLKMPFTSSKRRYIHFHSYHTTSKKTHLPKRIALPVIYPPPPQNRLAFINAVKIAWSYKGKKSRRRSNSDKEGEIILENVNTQISTSLKAICKNDLPPITSEALSELSIPHLFKSIQIRHDLLIDPNLTFCPNLSSEKKLQSDIYWTHLDNLIQSYTRNTLHPLRKKELISIVKNIVTELSEILVSLISPFPQVPASSKLGWDWPSQVTEHSIIAVLNPDLITSQLQQDCLNVESKFSFLTFILRAISPKRAQSIQQQIELNQYASALGDTFLALESIKLECVNRFLQYYRPYLIETGTHLEWKVFIRQLDSKEIELSTVREWIIRTWKRLGTGAKFMQVFRTGVLNLITEDKEIISIFDLPDAVFPITFFYDEKWLTNQLRHEFQNIIVIGLLLIPYRHMAGRYASESGFNQLKKTYSKLLNSASIANESVSYFNLALHACTAAYPDQQERQTFIIEQATYWSNWMNSNLKNSSEIYKLMYTRVHSCLLKNELHHATVGLEPEINKLRKKLDLIVDYNFRTFGSLYTYLLPSVRHQLDMT